MPESTPPGGGAPLLNTEATPVGSGGMVVIGPQPARRSLEPRPVGSRTSAESVTLMQRPWARADEATSGPSTSDLDAVVDALRLQFTDYRIHLQTYV